MTQLLEFSVMRFIRTWIRHFFGRGKRVGERRVTPDIAAKIVQLRADGVTAREIARRFAISERTVFRVRPPQRSATADGTATADQPEPAA